jgi:hypothetical protein
MLSMTACFDLHRPSYGHHYKQTFQYTVKYSAIIIRPMRSNLCYISYYNIELYIILPCESKKHSGLFSMEVLQCAHCCLCITVRLQL